MQESFPPGKIVIVLRLEGRGSHSTDPARGEALFLGYPGSLHGGPLPFQSFCSLSQVSALNLLIPGKQPTGPACQDRAVEGAVLLSSGQKLRKSKATVVQSDPEPL